MVGFKGLVLGAVVAAVATMGVQTAHALPIVSVLSDTGTLVTTTYAPPSSTSSVAVPTPYGSGTVTVTQVTASSWKVSFNPGSGFFASANNLSGGKTSTFSGLIAFDITFDAAINLTTNVFEDGIYSTAGNGRVGVNSPDLSSGIVVSQLDAPGAPESHGGSFNNPATTIVTPLITPPANSFPGATSGVWTLYDKLTGFSKSYVKYHVVIDNDLIAESLDNANHIPGFASIAKKDFSIVFTGDGSNGGGPNLPGGTPEPASLGVLALGGLSLLARRRF